MSAEEGKPETAGEKTGLPDWLRKLQTAAAGDLSAGCNDAAELVERKIAE